MAKRTKRKGRQKIFKARTSQSAGGSGFQSITPAEAVVAGLQHHQAGRLQQAGQVYRQVLATDPDHVDANHLLGVLAYQTGRTDEAIQLIRKALSGKPDFVEAFNNLGNALMNRGLLDEAGESYQKAISLKPDYAEAYNNLGNVFQDQGRTDEAVASYQKAVSLKPGFIEAHNNLGTAYTGLGLSAEAVGCFRKALALKPDYPEAHINLGHLFQAQRRLHEAESCYRKAVSINGESAEAHLNLGKVLKQQGASVEAETCFDKAASINQGRAETLNSFGNTSLAQGHLAQAAISYRKALSLKPDFAEAYNSLGYVRQCQGRLEQAITCYHKALSIKPGYAKAHRLLAMARRHTAYDNGIKAMELLYCKAGISDEQKTHLAFGLGKCFEDLGQYEKAFDFWLTGNRLYRKTFLYDLTLDRRIVKQLREVFTASFFRQYQDAGARDNTPIFILGMPRSGTSLVEQILASHPQGYGAGELVYMKQICLGTAGAAGQTFPDNIRRLGSEVFAALGREYVRQLKKHSATATFITDKMPQNFLAVGMIQVMLPKARIIHCRRNPMDTCLSVFKNYFTSQQPYAYDLKELGEYYRLYQELMDHWHQVLPGVIYDLHYEELVSEPEGQIRNLLEVCGLPFDEACLDFYQTDRAVLTTSSAQVRRPIYRDSLLRWKHYEKQLEPLRKAIFGGQ